MVNGLLVKSFPEIVSTDFTAQMEERSTRSRRGRPDWVRAAAATSTRRSSSDLEKAKVEMRDVKREEIPTEHVCEKCGKAMVIKWGRNGHFLACSGYPECRNTKEYTRDADGSITGGGDHPRDQREVPHLRLADGDPPRPLRRVPGLLALPRVQDHQPDLDRRGLPAARLRRLPDREALARAARSFFGCSNYSKTKCDFVSWDRPVPRACPQLQRRLHRGEGLQGRRAPPLHRRRLRLLRRQGRRRGRAAAAAAGSAAGTAAAPAPVATATVPPDAAPDPDAKAS